MLRSEDRALGGPTSKEAELDREMEREELVCPSPGPWQTGVKSLQLGDGDGMRTINLRRCLKCSKQQWRVGAGVRGWVSGSPEGGQGASFGNRGRRRCNQDVFKSQFYHRTNIPRQTQLPGINFEHLHFTIVTCPASPSPGSI